MLLYSLSSVYYFAMKEKCCHRKEYIMQQTCEMIMLICFGLSWPISVYKSLTSHSTQGKSIVFMVAIVIGYLSGIAGKLVGGQINYVLILYCLNLTVVSFDMVLFFANKRRERRSVKLRKAIV